MVRSSCSTFSHCHDIPLKRPSNEEIRASLCSKAFSCKRLKSHVRQHLLVLLNCFSLLSEEKTGDVSVWLLLCLCSGLHH